MIASLRIVSIRFTGFILFTVMLCLCGSAYSQIAEKYPLIPQPREVIFGESEVAFNEFRLTGNDFVKTKNLLRQFLLNQGLTESKRGVEVSFSRIKNNGNDEAYNLTISNKVAIAATHEKGAFLAFQTLKQLITFGKSTKSLPQLSIKDTSAFKVRGFMHDTGRNFQSTAQLKAQIEVAAAYKYNVFHWHLTDNPAWRLESKIYPELQSAEATTRRKGDFYTQEDFKEIVQFCKDRHITVIPEFDIPGHTDAFRRALEIEKMSDPKVKTILLDLFTELCNLTDAETVPYIHIGTDEVRNPNEYIDKSVILDIMALLKSRGRDIIVWEKGVRIAEDSTSIGQLWAMNEPREGHRFIDSRANYVNHLDPFAGMVRLFFQQPCRQPRGDVSALGGILCAWPDNRVANERDILKQNPIYPAMLFYAEAIWNGKEKNHPEYWAKLPPRSSVEFRAFADFEKKVVTHRDAFFNDKEFPYVAQANIAWKLIGPFENDGDFTKKFPVESKIENSSQVSDKTYEWSQKVTGATIHLKHFFGFPAYTEAKNGTYYAFTHLYSPTDRTQDFWVGFQGWSRSGGRRGGPTPKKGEWHFTQPQIWVNDSVVSPPVWQQPEFAEKSDEIPFIDEDYFYRSPTKIALKKGWNKILLKIPHGGNSWKWMFTCVPVTIENNNVREVSDLIFEPSLQLYSDHYYKRKALFEETPDTAGEIIMLGNSITESGNWKALFPEINIVNRGISGDVTDGILNRMEELTSSKPEKLFLMIGTNDLARGKSVEFITHNIETIIQEIKGQSPKTKIYLQGILPINPKVGQKFSGHKQNGGKIVATNEILQKMAAECGLVFVDLHKAFSDENGHLTTEFTHDGLHLTEAGYQHWKRTIRKFLQ